MTRILPKIAALLAALFVVHPAAAQEIGSNPPGSAIVSENLVVTIAGAWKPGATDLGLRMETSLHPQCCSPCCNPPCCAPKCTCFHFSNVPGKMVKLAGVSDADQVRSIAGHIGRKLVLPNRGKKLQAYLATAEGAGYAAREGHFDRMARRSTTNPNTATGAYEFIQWADNTGKIDTWTSGGFFLDSSEAERGIRIADYDVVKALQMYDELGKKGFPGLPEDIDLPPSHDIKDLKILLGVGEEASLGFEKMRTIGNGEMRVIIGASGFELRGNVVGEIELSSLRAASYLPGYSGMAFGEIGIHFDGWDEVVDVAIETGNALGADRGHLFAIEEDLTGVVTAFAKNAGVGHSWGNAGGYVHTFDSSGPGATMYGDISAGALEAMIVHPNRERAMGGSYRVRLY